MATQGGFGDFAQGIQGGTTPPNQLGLSSPPVTQGQASSTPDQGLGLTSPPAASPSVASPPIGTASPPGQSYDSLFNDASNFYLANGGTQANVNAYAAAHPERNYGTLFNDAAGWYSQQPGYNGGIADYFAANNPVGSPYNMGDIASAQMGQGAALGTMSGSAPGQGLGGAAPAPAQGSMPTPGATQGGMPPGPQGATQGALAAPAPAMGTAPAAPQAAQAAPGPIGSLSAALYNDPNPYTPKPADIAQQQADQAAYGPGSGTIWDPWNQTPTAQMMQANPNAYPGYALQAGTRTLTNPLTGQVTTIPNQNITKWDQANGPAPSYTQAGQAQMNQPFSLGGQQFGGLQSLLDFMGTSTPAEQALKTRMEGMDAQGGSLQPGEKTLFSALAPYLGQNVGQFPSGATPFTNWDPVGLLKILQGSGLFTAATNGLQPAQRGPYDQTPYGPQPGTGVVGGAGGGAGGTGGSSGAQPWQPGGPAGGWGPAPHAPYSPGPYGPQPGTGTANGRGAGGGQRGGRGPR